MARRFVPASSQALTSAVAVFDLPVSFHIWAKAPSTLSADRTLLSSGLSTVSNQFASLLIRSTGALRYRHNAGGSPTAVTSTGTVAANQIFQAGAVHTSTTDRKLYLNGTLDGSSTTGYGSSIPGWDYTAIGRVAENGTAPEYYDGWLAEFAMWDIDLTAAEMASLAAGENPIKIRPENLITYNPLYGDASPEIPYFGAFAFTLVNSPAAEEAHPPVYGRGRRWVFMPPVGGTAYFMTPGGVIAPTSVLTRGSAKTIIGASTPAGAIVRASARTVAGLSTPTGLLVKAPARIWSGASLATGLLLRAPARVLVGSSTPTGAVVKASSKTVVGSSTPTGRVGLGKAMNNLAGVLGLSGLLTRASARSWFGSTTPTSTLVSIRAFLATFSGEVTPTGLLIRGVAKTLRGASTPTSALSEQASRVFVGSTLLLGAVVKASSRTFVGASAPASTLDVIRALLITWTGAVTPTGSIRRDSAKNLVGLSTPSGSLSRSLSTRYVSTLSLSGTLAKSVSRTFLGSTTPTGALAVMRFIGVVFVGSIIPVGVAVLSTLKVFQASTALSGVLLRSTARTYQGALPVAGVLLRSVSRLWSSALGLLGSLLTQSGSSSAASSIEVPISYQPSISIPMECSTSITLPVEYEES